MAMPASEIQACHDMFALADRLRDLKNHKAALDKELKEVNAQIEQIDQALAQLMVNEEMQSFVRGGQTFYLNTRLFASAIAERKEELFAWLKDNGYGDLVQETVNANSLSAWVRELKENNGDELPPDLTELVNVFEKTSVGVRKAS